MDITTLDKEYIEGAMYKSMSHNRNITSVSNFKKGWEAAIRFAKKVERSEEICTQCGKLVEMAYYDSQGVPFCDKCYDKLEYIEEGKDVSQM